MTDVINQGQARPAATATPPPPPPPGALSPAVVEQILFEMKRLIVGQDIVLERCWSPCYRAATSC